LDGGGQGAFVHESFRTRVIARAGALEDLPGELASLGVTRPLVLSSAHSGRSRAAADLRRLLASMDPLQQSDVPQHASLAQVEATAASALRHGIDGIVAIGGGSVSDTAKAVAVTLAEGAPLARLATRHEVGRGFVTPNLLRPKLPIVTVPMTASGAEITPAFGICSTDGSKLLFRDGGVVSRVVLIDPVAQLDVPARILLETGMNGLAHCIEGLYSRRRSPISSVLAIEGVARFFEALPALHDAPLDAGRRMQVLVAATLSGQVLASTGSCLHHAICHVLGARLNLPHGFVNSVILPHAVAAVAPRVEVELSPACARIGVQGAARLAAAMSDLQVRIGVPRRLRERVPARESLAGIAQQVLHERGMANNPYQVDDPGEIAAVLEAAW
jgi:alcohol dehydrogenase class IV